MVEFAGCRIIWKCVSGVIQWIKVLRCFSYVGGYFVSSSLLFANLVVALFESENLAKKVSEAITRHGNSRARAAVVGVSLPNSCSF